MEKNLRRYTLIAAGFFMEKNRAGAETEDRLIWIGMLALAGILVIAAVIWSGFLEDAAQENLATKTGQQTRRGSAGESFADHPVDGSRAGESVHQLERRRPQGRRLCN